MAFDDGAPKQNFFRSFSPWAKWAERERLDDGHGFSVHDYSGVYLLAHFDNRPPSGTAEYLDDAIFYVGEAVWLKRRWRQFQDSARDGLPGHSGGHTYRATFKPSKLSRLYVAAMPVWFGDAKLPRSEEDWTQSFRLYVERSIIWGLTVRQAAPMSCAPPAGTAPQLPSWSRRRNRVMPFQVQC